MTRSIRRTLRASVVALLVAASVSFSAPSLRAQGADTPTTFDRAGLIPVITHSYADRIGLRPPGWRVQGDYREVRVLKGERETYALVVSQADGTTERLPLDAEQFESLRLEVETRVGVLSGGAAAAATSPATPTTAAGTPNAPAIPAASNAASPAGAPSIAGASSAPPNAPATYAYRAEEPSKPDGGDFARNQLVLGAVLYGPLTAALVENGPAAIATYMATVAATYFAVVKPSREGKFTAAQARLSTGLAVGGAMAGASLGYVLGLGDIHKPLVADKGTLGFALAGAFAGALSGTVMGRTMTDAEAEGLTFGAGTGLLFASGLLAATKGESSKGDARLLGAFALAGLGTGSIIGYNYASRVSYTVTSGDLTGLASPGIIGMLAGLTIARPTSSSASVTSAAALTTAGLAAGLLAGDWFFVRRWDMTPRQGWILNLGTLAGAALMTTPFWLGDQRDPGVLFGAATVGGLLGAWGVTQLSDFAPGTMRARPASRTTRVARGPGDDAVQFDVTSALMAASGVPGRHALLSIRF